VCDKPTYEELERTVQELEQAEFERKKAVDALQESEERLDFVLKGSQLGFWDWNLESNEVKRNERWAEMLGYKLQDIDFSVKQWIDFIHPDDRAAAIQSIQDHLEGRTPMHKVEYRMLTKDGEHRWILDQAQVVKRDSHGRPIRMSGTHTDITEHKLAREALRLSAVWHRTLVATIPDLVWLKDMNGIYLSCNPTFERFFGAKESDIVGKTDYDFKDKDLADFFREHDRKAVLAGGPSINEEWLTFADNGYSGLFETIKTPMHNAEGSLIGVLGISRDISERKRAEDALRESESFIKAVMDNLPIGVAVNSVHPSVNFVYMNDKFPTCYRTTREELADPDVFWEAVYEDPEFREEIRKRVLDDCASDDPERMYWIDVPISRREGETTYVTARNVLVPHKQLMISIVWDVTERKKAEEEHRRLEERLHRAEKMEALGTLAGGVAHDLNNVLGIVVGYSELLLEDLDESSSARSEAMEILKGGQRAAAIVQDLLTLARRGVPSRKVLNLNSIIMECRNSPEFAKVLSYHPSIEFRADFEADLLNMSGSSVHLAKSFMNLVSNAAEAMPYGGTLTVKTANRYLDKPISGYDEMREGDYVVLTMSDTGEGIPAPDLKRIFEPFYTKKVMGRSGTGLGLAVVWGTVKDHNGYINVESEQGKGTTFTLYFPVTRDDITSERFSISAEVYIGNGESILIVDDVKEQQELAARMLTKLHYRVTTVSSGEEAVEYLKQQAVDLIVLDMIMDPGMDGLDTYSKILEIHPRQKAIIVSGFSETERVRRAHALGAGPYVKKPYVLETLGLAVKDELARPVT